MDLLIFFIVAGSVCAFFLFVATRQSRPLATEQERESSACIAAKSSQTLLADVDALRSELRVQFAQVNRHLNRIETAMAADRHIGVKAAGE